MSVTFTVKGSMTIVVEWENSGDAQDLKKAFQQLKDATTSCVYLEPLFPLADKAIKVMEVENG